MVPIDADVRVIGPDHPWVSRGGIKLAHALDAFGIDAAGAIAFDIGASTGGFTDVWLQRGARHVIALDVGHSQLHWKMRSDPRVTVIENTNARHLKPGDLPDAGAPITRVSIDVSFISLRHIFPVLPPLDRAGLRHRRAGQAAVRGRAQGCRQGRTGPRSRRARARGRRGDQRRR